MSQSDPPHPAPPITNSHDTFVSQGFYCLRSTPEPQVTETRPSRVNLQNRTEGYNLIPITECLRYLSITVIKTPGQGNL